MSAGVLALWPDDGEFGAYLKAGINVGLGTDTEPHNMLEEMRIAVTLGRIASENIRGIELSDVFNVATIGGARALGRDDLGRLAVGAKADIVLLDLDCPQMMPVRDPLRSLVFTAADRAVRDVYVDGRQVVANGTPIAIDLLATGRAAEIIQAGTIANVPNADYLKRTAEQISPFVLPIGGL